MSAVELLKQLIAFPSVSSATNDYVSEFTESQLVRLGFETERLTYTDSSDILKVCICGRRGPEGKGLAYFCHTDVVPAETWSFPQSGPWSALEFQNRVYGRGSCDMKGSLACMLEAVERIQFTTSPVFLVCTADEEVGYHGAAKVAADSAIYREIVDSGSLGLIGEPTRLGVVHGHKGSRVGRIVSRGVAAHSSTPHGINANMAMIPFLHDLRALSLECDMAPEWRDERFDPPVISMNIGINDHTAAINITPPESICTFYFRPMPGQDADRLVDRISSLADRHHLDFELFITSDGLFTDPESEFIRELENLTSTESCTVPYGTDGSLFGEVQNLAVLGPGDIRQAHTDDEWIALEQLAGGVDLYERLIRRWCV